MTYYKSFETQGHEIVALESQRSVVVLGAGGHAKVAISTLRAAGWIVTAAYDDAPERVGTRVMGVPVIGPIEAAAGLATGNRVVIGIGTPQVRQQLAGRYDFEWISVVHPYSYVDPTVELGEGVLVFAGAVVQPETVLGRHTVVNTSASIDHEGRIGDFVNINPGAHLSGNVKVGELAQIGVGAAVLQGISIGAETVVGGGATVIRDLPERVVAVGCPARIVRSLDRSAA